MQNLPKEAISFELALSFDKGAVEVSKAQQLQDELLEVLQRYLPFSAEGTSVCRVFRATALKLALW